MWPIDREVPRRTTGLHNVDITSSLVAQLEALTKKLDSLTKNVNMVHQSKPVYKGYRVDHIIERCHLASTHVIPPEEVNYTQKFQMQQDNPYSNTYNLG